jgi:hypothetical protein
MWNTSESAAGARVLKIIIVAQTRHLLRIQVKEGLQAVGKGQQ